MIVVGSSLRQHRLAVMRLYLTAVQGFCLIVGHKWRARYDLWPAVDLGDEGWPGSVADVCDRCRLLRNFRTLTPEEANRE